mmetsp:Transcript_31288/g.73746  ORF Transcript_31288/g.73746 Transcript_31288/m.73746 type:complete len:341 (-) Transcript_31288:645-1667(-)
MLANPRTGVPSLRSRSGSDMRRITLSTPDTLSVTFTGVTTLASSSSASSASSSSVKSTSAFSTALSSATTAAGRTSTSVAGRENSVRSCPSASTAATLTSTKCEPASVMGTSSPIVAGSNPLSTLRTTAARPAPTSRTTSAKCSGASSQVRASATITCILLLSTGLAQRFGQRPPWTSTPQRTTALSSARRGIGGLVTVTARAGMWKSSTMPSSVHSATENCSQCSPASPSGTSIPIVSVSLSCTIFFTTDARLEPSGSVLRAIRHRCRGAVAAERCTETIARREPPSTCFGTSIPQRRMFAFSPRRTGGGLVTCTLRPSIQNTSIISPLTTLAICTVSS